MEEESGVRAKSLRQVGLLLFEFIGDPQLMEVHVYSTEQFDGAVVESDGRYLLCSAANCVPTVDSVKIVSQSWVNAVRVSLQNDLGESGCSFF